MQFIENGRVLINPQLLCDDHNVLIYLYCLFESGRPLKQHAEENLRLACSSNHVSNAYLQLEWLED